MASKVKITDQKELEVFVGTHLDHRLTALVAPIFDDANAYRNGRGDISKSAQEGSYVMLRLFIEFLGVKGRLEKGVWTLKRRDTLKNGKDIKETDLVLSCFMRRNQQLQALEGSDFGNDESFIAKTHEMLCKINAHFTYDVSKPSFRDRIAGLPRPDLEKAVEIVVNKLDEHFYQKVRQDVVVHRDLREQFKKRFSGVKSGVKSN